MDTERWRQSDPATESSRLTDLRSNSPSAPSGEARRHAARQVPDAWKTWIGAMGLRGTPHQELVDIMVRNGIDREAAAAEVARAVNDPYMAVARQVQQQLGRTVATLNTLSDLQALHSSAGAIERRSNLTQRAFVDEYYALNRPVLIEGLMDDWPAMQRWTPDYLKSRLGDEIVEVMADSNAVLLNERRKRNDRQEVRFGDFVDMVYSEQGTDYYIVAANNFFQRPHLSALIDDIRLLPDYLRHHDNNNGVFLWFGPAGTLTPLHHDAQNIFMAQVSGRKRVKMVPFNQIAYLNIPARFFSDVDPDNPDFDRFPEFRKATVFDFVLNPGEVLFMPVGWWHHVRALDPTIMVAFTNFALPNAFNWSGGYPSTGVRTSAGSRS